MSKCIRCEKLNDELQSAALEYLKATAGHKANDEVTKAIEQKMDQVHERLIQHRAKHERSLGSTA